MSISTGAKKYFHAALLEFYRGLAGDPALCEIERRDPVLS
jgi:hypothetical protein